MLSICDEEVLRGAASTTFALPLLYHIWNLAGTGTAAIPYHTTCDFGL